MVIEITGRAYDGNRMAPRGRSERMRTIGALAAPLALMAVIYLVSAQPDLNSGLGAFDLIGRKLVHMTEYGLLWWLWSRALGFRRPLLAAVITLAYAATDEYHQTFVAGRHGSPLDWGIDAAGVAAAWLAQRALREFLNRRAKASDDPRTVAGLLAGSMIARGWLVALAIFGVGLVENDAGLAAGVLCISLFTVMLSSEMFTRPFEDRK